MCSEKYAGYLSLQRKVCRISHCANNICEKCAGQRWRSGFVQAAGGGGIDMADPQCTDSCAQYAVHSSQLKTVHRSQQAIEMEDPQCTAGSFAQCKTILFTVQCTFYFRFCKVYLFQVGQRTAQRSFILVQNAHIGVQFTAHCTLNTTSLNFQRRGNV